MGIKTPKKFRNTNGSAVEDPSNIANLQYNEASGGQKNLKVGPFLQPLNNGAGGYTTDATTARGIRKGSILAVYNNSGTLYSITFGTSSAVVSLASGVANTSGDVGHPCKPNDWSYFSSDEKNFIISQNVALLVFVMKDDSYIVQQQQG